MNVKQKKLKWVNKMIWLVIKAMNENIGCACKSISWNYVLLSDTIEFVSCKIKRQVMKWMIWWWRMITRCEDEMTIFAIVYRRSFQNEEVYHVSSVYAQSLCKLVLNNFSNNFIPCFSQRQPVCCQEATRHSQRSRTFTVVSP